MSKLAVDRFTELYRAQVDGIHAYAVARVGPDRAAEVVQETFLVAWRRLDELPDEPRPWLFGVARRVLANERRSGVRRAALSTRASTAPDAKRREPDLAERVVERDRVLAVLARQSDADRELLSLSAWSGLAPDEIAEVLGCTRAALRVRLHRARRRFEAGLEAEDRPTTARDPAELEQTSRPAPAREPEAGIRTNARLTAGGLPPRRRPTTMPKEALQ